MQFCAAFNRILCPKLFLNSQCSENIPSYLQIICNFTRKKIWRSFWIVGSQRENISSQPAQAEVLPVLGILMTCIVITWNIVWIMAHVDRIIQAYWQQKMFTVELKKNIWVTLPDYQHCFHLTLVLLATRNQQYCLSYFWLDLLEPLLHHLVLPERIWN